MEAKAITELEGMKGDVSGMSREALWYEDATLHYRYHLLKAYGQKCGIDKKVTAIAFRFTMATDMLRGHADIRHIQEMLGHRSLATTQHYTYVIKDDLKKVHKKTHPREQVRCDIPIYYIGVVA